MDFNTIKDHIKKQYIEIIRLSAIIKEFKIFIII